MITFAQFSNEKFSRITDTGSPFVDGLSATISPWVALGAYSEHHCLQGMEEDSSGTRQPVLVDMAVEVSAALAAVPDEDS